MANCPPPQVERPGWYPDPLGSTAERFWNGAWEDEIRVAQRRLADDALANGAGRRRGTWRLPRLPLLGRGAREQREQEREEQELQRIAESRRQAFYRTPAGRARIAFERGQSLFQYELDVGQMDSIVVPGPLGQPPVQTTDPVDVLNSVATEGWKLVSSEFHHVEVRGGMVGCYVFKRSQKRRRRMNDPWQS